MRGSRGFSLLGLLVLVGCAEAGQPAAPETALAPIVKRDGVSLADATVALVSVDGAPDAAAQDFRQALARQFAAREVASADPRKAHYLLRAYLSASPADGGASFDYVVDVFDQRRVRLARLAESYAVKGSGDAWSLMSAAALDGVAAASADEVAAFLSNTADAKPASPALSFAE